MDGDQYHIFYCKAKDPHTYHVEKGVQTNWRLAKAERNKIFNSASDIKSAWIIRTNPSMNLRPEKYGETLTRYIRK